MPSLPSVDYSDHNLLVELQLQLVVDYLEEGALQLNLLLDCLEGVLLPVRNPPEVHYLELNHWVLSLQEAHRSSVELQPNPPPSLAALQPPQQAGSSASPEQQVVSSPCSASQLSKHLPPRR